MSQTERDPENDAGAPRGALIALLVIAALIAAAAVAVNRIGAASRLQDCVQSGRGDCAPIQGGSSS